MGSIMKRMPASVAGIDLPGLSVINPMLHELAQRGESVSLLALLRDARDRGLDVSIRGNAHGSAGEPPRPETPFSVLWFDGDMPAHGRIGIGMVGSSWDHSRRGSAPVPMMTEESWTQSDVAEVDDPWAEPSLMRWSPERGWLNDHVIYLSEPRPFRFLVNWWSTGWRPDGSTQVVGRSSGDP